MVKTQCTTVLLTWPDPAGIVCRARSPEEEDMRIARIAVIALALVGLLGSTCTSHEEPEKLETREAQDLEMQEAPGSGMQDIEDERGFVEDEIER
jgi:hypothetical protein